MNKFQKGFSPIAMITIMAVVLIVVGASLYKWNSANKNMKDVKTNTDKGSWKNCGLGEVEKCLNDGGLNAGRRISMDKKGMTPVGKEMLTAIIILGVVYAFLKIFKLA